METGLIEAIEDIFLNFNLLYLVSFLMKFVIILKYVLQCY